GVGWREVRLGDAARAPALTEMPVGAKPARSTI
ncbi:metallophosphoesterase, partial [Burkholderia pseudomallei]|nr:metallophosphoesterase [Burkholderia pseudomallei]